MHVVRRECRRDQRAEECLHLVRRQRFAGLHCCLAGDGRDEQLVARVRGRAAIAAQRGERFTEAAQCVKSFVRRGDRVDDDRVAAERFELEPQSRKGVPVLLE